MSRSSSSMLLAAESMLAFVERSRTRVRAIQRTPEILDGLVLGSSTEDEVMLHPPEDFSSAAPPIRETSSDTPYEEQLTQALSEDMIAELEEAAPEPPVRRPAPPVRPAEVALDGAEEEPLVQEEPPVQEEAPEEEELPLQEEPPAEEEPPVQTSSADTDATGEAARAEGRARAAAQVREAQRAAKGAVQRAKKAAQEADDRAFKQARTQGVAAIQLTTSGDVRTIRDSVAIGEAQREDLAQEAARSSQAEGGFQIDVLIPEVEVEESASLPELTDSAAPFSSLQTLEVKDDPVPGMIAEFLGTARAAENRGDLQKAIIAYGDALDVNADLEIAWIGRGRCRTEIGDFGAALSDLKRAQGIAPGSIQPVIEMGHLFYTRKDYLRAIHYYGEVLSQEPEHAMALGRRGLCHHYMEDSAQALRDLTEAMNIDPSLPNLKQSLEMVEQASSTTS